MGEDEVLIMVYLRTLQLAHGNSFVPPVVWRCLVLCPERAWELAGTQGFAQRKACVGDVQSAHRIVGKLT